MRHVALVAFLTLCALQAQQQYTRGVGVYPGDPKEDFAAQVVPDASRAYRNLALDRAAYQSSSYDFNLTAQLATDGIKETVLPRWYVISTNEGVLTTQLREHTQDHNDTTNTVLNGAHAWMEFELCGGGGPPELDRVETSRVSVMASAEGAAGWSMIVRGSDVGRRGRSWAARPSVAFTSPARKRFIRVEFEAPAATRWTISELILKDKGEPLGYDLSAIRTLPQVKVEATTTATVEQGNRWLLTTVLRNAGSAPALMARVKAVRSASGDRILPALYSDNYVALMPGEKRTIKTELENEDTRGERPRIVVEGFNVEKPAAKAAAKQATAE